MFSLQKRICSPTLSALRNSGRMKLVCTSSLFLYCCSLLIILLFLFFFVLLMYHFHLLSTCFETCCQTHILTIGCVCFLQVSSGCMDVGFIVQEKLFIWPLVSSWKRRYSRVTITAVCLSARSWGNVLCYL